MARTSTNKSQAQNTTTNNGAELSKRRHLAFNSLRKRGVEFPEEFLKLYTLMSITESAYYKFGNGTITSEEASKIIDDALARHREEYNPLDNPNLL